MRYYGKSIVPVIESKYDSLTQVEKNIADFFLENREKSDFSAKGIADRLYVSEASLSRFAQKCGFHGYRDFIYQYENSLAEEQRMITSNTKNVLDMYQDLLNKAYSLTDEAQIRRIVGYLNESDRVIVCGKGSSGLAANEMEMRFMRIGVNIDSLQDSDRMRMQAVFVGKGNMVVGISVSADTEEVLYLLKESHGRGARTLLLTSNNKETLSEFCDEVVVVPSLKFLYNVNAISPQFPVLVMIDILYYYYVNQDKDSRTIMHGETLKALKGKQKKRF